MTTPTNPGDSLSRRRKLLYILMLGALTALGPFTVDLYLPAVPALEGTVATTLTRTLAPGSSVPTEHETWLPVRVQVPRSATAERTMREEGRVSVTRTAVAVESPLLVATSV